MNNKQDTRYEMTPRAVFRALLRHRKKAIAFFLLVMTATVLITVATPKAYLSESKLFVRLGRENAMLDSTATLGNSAVVALPSSRESEINSVAEMLGSRVTMERVVDELGPDFVLGEVADSPSEETATTQGLVQWLEGTGSQARKWISGVMGSLRSAISVSTLTARDRAIEQVGKNVAVSPARRTNVICVSYEASDPKLAQAVVASVVNAYLRQHVSLNRTRGTHEFFAEHTKRLGDELKHLEAEFVELKTTTGLTSADEQQTQIVARIGRLEDELLVAKAARAETETKAEALKEKLASLPKEQVLETNTGIGNAGTDMIRDAFFALQVQEKEAAAIYTANHPKLQMLREELAEAERILAEQEPTRTQVKTVPDATYEQTRLALSTLEPELAALGARTKSLESQLADVRDSLKTLNSNEVRIAQLTREIELREGDYRKYAMNLEEARIDQAMEGERMSNISVAQPASFEPQAIRPRKKVNLALGFLVAVGGAIGVALLAEYLNQSKRIQDDVRRPLALSKPASMRMNSEALSGTRAR